jgi:hypothetical protein
VDGEAEGEMQEEEDVGLEVEMLPEHLVKALKAKYETENAQEALSKALKDEEEGKGTILSEVMADLDADDEDDANDSAVTAAAALENTADEHISDTDVEAQDDVENSTNDNNEPKEQTKEPSPSIELETAESSPESKGTGNEIEAIADDIATEEEPVEEVRTKIEQLSIDDVDVESKSFEEKKETDDSLAVADESVNDETTQQAKLFYNMNSHQFFTSNDNVQASEEIIDLLDLNQRTKLNVDQTQKVKEGLIALQDQIASLIASV